MQWNKTQIKQHKKAAEILGKIIKYVAEFIKNNSYATEVEVRQFIKTQYKKYHLISDKQKSIIAFNKNTSNVHYFAEQSHQLKNNNLIMVDIWAKLAEKNAPFADITWMLYYGKNLPKQYADIFRIVAKARDKAINYLRNNLKRKIIPIGKDIDAIARNYLDKHGYGDKFLHSAGHSLGFTSPHGKRVLINRKGRQSLPLNVGYTIEPGIYFKNKFGVRSEINFFINKNYKLIITTKIQKKIIKISAY